MPSPRRPRRSGHRATCSSAADPRSHDDHRPRPRADRRAEGCEPQARAFYGRLLGLAEIPKPAGLAARGGVWFKLGHQELHVGVERTFAPARKAHPALLVQDGPGLHRLAQAIEADGHGVSWDRELPGVERFYVDDPWGNRLEVVSG